MLKSGVNAALLPPATHLDDSCFKRAANVSSLESLLEIEGDRADLYRLQLSK